MAACGASDSVITQTPVSLRSCRSLFFSSLFLSTGGSAQQNHAFILSTISCTLHYLSHRRTAAAEETPAQPRRNENGTKWRKRKPLRSLSFHSTGERERRRSRSVRRTGERGPFISIRHALIYISHIYLHTLLFCSERGKTILQNMYLRWPDCNFGFLSLPFMVSAKHSGLK